MEEEWVAIATSKVGEGEVFIEPKPKLAIWADSAKPGLADIETCRLPKPDLAVFLVEAGVLGLLLWLFVSHSSFLAQISIACLKLYDASLLIVWYTYTQEININLTSTWAFLPSTAFHIDDA
jgi:hypothetical protein